MPSATGGFRGNEARGPRGARPHGPSVAQRFPPFDVLNRRPRTWPGTSRRSETGLGLREGVRVGAVKLWETDTASATYREDRQESWGKPVTDGTFTGLAIIRRQTERSAGFNSSKEPEKLENVPSVPGFTRFYFP